MKYITIVCLLIMNVFAFANQITILSETEIYQIVNTNNKKIYPYHLVPSGKTISLQVEEIDSLEILTRQLIESSESIEYSYEISIADSLYPVQKSARRSSVSRGVTGEKVSTYNKYVLGVPSEREKITIKNTSSHSFIIKFDAEQYSRQKKTVDFVAFTPENYETETVIVIEDRHFTYFKPDDSTISLTLEGPLELKIISRLLFDDSFSIQQNYRYKVFINEIEQVEYIETAMKSQKAKLLLLEDTGVSTGNVQQLPIEKGIQKIRIEAPDQNREVIFRFFINKTAIRN